MRLLVTGATGNVGTALLRRLASEPDVEVVGLARRRPRAVPPYEGVQWETLDLADPTAPAALVRAMRGVDAVVHLAWMLQPAREGGRMRATNLDGSRHVLAAAREAGVRHLVVASSAGAYAPGPQERPGDKARVDESWPTTGVTSSSYSRQKAALERMLDEAQEQDPALAVARIRPMLVCQRAAASSQARLFLGAFSLLLGRGPAKLLGRVPLPALPLPRELVFQVVHAEDLADAIWRVLQARATGGFNVAAEPPVGPHELAGAFGALTAPPVPLRAFRAFVAATYRARVHPTPEGWVDLGAQAPLVDTTRLRTELGWQPRWSGPDAVGELVAGIRHGAGAPSAPLQPQAPA